MACTLRRISDRRTPPRTVSIAALAVALSLFGASCSDDSEIEDDPGELERIDGPAQVDPDVEVGGSSGTDG